MINPGVLLKAYADLIRAVPEIAAALGQDIERIIPYFGECEATPSLTLAIYRAPAPGLLVVYRGFSPKGGRGTEYLRHDFSVIFRPGETFGSDPPENHYQVLQLLMDGVPSGSGLALSLTQWHPDLNAPDVATCRRVALVVDLVGTQLDYWQIDISCVEKS